MPDNEDVKVAAKDEEVESSLPPITKLKRWQWWCLVFLNICFLLVGQAAAILLLRFYYDQGGRCKWAATLAQNAGFPILFIPFILFPSIKESSPKSPAIVVLSVYFGLGVLIVGDNLLYSVGLAYLSTSTYSIIRATQLAFSLVFSFFINSQKCTILTLNSVVLLSLSAALVGVSDHSHNPYVVTHMKYHFAFVATVAASALYALLLSLTQLSFQKVIKKKTFAVVLELQIHTSIVASCVSLVGLFASGEWRILRGEIASSREGSLSYAMALIWTAVAWQVCSVGVVGLLFVVSSLFSNVISTLSLSLSPLAAAVAFNRTMNGPKIIAVFMGLWGFWTYDYRNCHNDHKGKKNKHPDNDKCPECAC